jgi:ABC-type sulfate transport system permease subunit
MADAATSKSRVAAGEPVWLRLLLITLAVGFLTLIVLLPLAAVFAEAFRQGMRGHAWETRLVVRPWGLLGSRPARRV